MGCNTSKEPLASADADKDAETNKEGGNNVGEVNEQSEEKPPSAKTITLKSASNSKPNSATPEGTKNDIVVDEEELDPELDQAAVKIQAVFRGHQTRKTMKQEDKSTKTESAQQEQQQLEDEFSSDDVELTHAATKIQASFRGHMVRKQKMEKGDEVPEKPEHPTPEEEELDIDLTDPELHKAATKIQASFRGHSSRRDPPTSESSQK